MQVRLILLALLYFFPVHAVNQAPLPQLDELISATRHSLDTQLKLREMIIQYQDLQARYMQDEENYDLLFKVAKSARAILELLQENRLAQTLDPAFISELKVVSKPATKRGIPKP